MGLQVANRLAAALEEPRSFGEDERALLRAAVDYFLLVDDGEHDLTSPNGFDDDRVVAEAVLRVLRP